MHSNMPDIVPNEILKSFQMPNFSACATSALITSPNLWGHGVNFWRLEDLAIYFSNYFFNPKLLLVYPLQFVFIKRSNNFFTIKIINDVSPWHSAINVFVNKNVFRSICSEAFYRNVC